MTKICTDIEQSKKLIELGIDRNSSDCSWILSPRNGHYILSLTAPLDDDIPAWSLAALLDVISYPTLSQDYNGKWSCMEFPGDEEVEGCDNPIDACVDMIQQLHEKKLI